MLNDKRLDDIYKSYTHVMVYIYICTGGCQWDFTKLLYWFLGRSRKPKWLMGKTSEHFPGEDFPLNQSDECINIVVTLWLCQNSYVKSPFSMGQSTINGHFP